MMLLIYTKERNGTYVFILFCFLSHGIIFIVVGMCTHTVTIYILQIIKSGRENRLVQTSRLVTSLALCYEAECFISTSSVLSEHLCVTLL